MYFHLKSKKISVVLAINHDICKHITKTYQFESSFTKRIYYVRSQSLNFASKNVVYLFSCKTCHKQYTGSTERFERFNNYRCAQRNIFKYKKS